jgi:hypothetical protein
MTTENERSTDGTEQKAPYDIAYVVRVGSQWVWTPDYNLAFQEATGLRMEEAEIPHPDEERIHAFYIDSPRTISDRESVDVQDICDEFVREHAVPAEDAESWVHIGIDDHYHPAGGYWFPTGETWGDASGWMSSKYDIPHGEVIQYPCSEKEPEVRGKDGVPDYAVNRTLSPETEHGERHK